MLQLIKGSLKQVIVDGDVPISNRIQTIANPKDAQHLRKNHEADFELDFDEELSETGEPNEPERQPEHEPVPEFITAPEPEYATIAMSELEALREHFRREGEVEGQELKRKAQIELAQAKEDADKIRQQAENQRLEKLRAIEADAANVLEKAKKEGFEIGYSEGMQKGADDGYVQGLTKCKETLLDLKSLCDSVDKEKAALMAENRRGIFDMAMSIAEKITMTVFRQRDKNALEKMIAEAAREFRSAKTVRVSLSKLDLSEDIEADLRILEKCFSDTAQVEFEVLEDAERGTLLVETDSEILDAGVSTQLRMIEELGRGKFRDKEPEASAAEETEDIGETVKAEKPKKTRKAKPKEPVAEPTVVEEAAEPVAAAVEAVTETVEPAAVEEPAAEPIETAAEEVPAEETAEDKTQEQEATEEQ